MKNILLTILIVFSISTWAQDYSVEIFETDFLNISPFKAGDTLIEQKLDINYVEIKWDQETESVSYPLSLFSKLNGVMYERVIVEPSNGALYLDGTSDYFFVNYFSRSEIFQEDLDLQDCNMFISEKSSLIILEIHQLYSRPNGEELFVLSQVVLEENGEVSLYYFSPDFDNISKKKNLFYLGLGHLKTFEVNDEFFEEIEFSVNLGFDSVNKPVIRNYADHLDTVHSSLFSPFMNENFGVYFSKGRFGSIEEIKKYEDERIIYPTDCYKFIEKLPEVIFQVYDMQRGDFVFKETELGNFKERIRKLNSGIYVVHYIIDGNVICRRKVLIND
ncbi:hypothetical protein [Luteibaculum oceani]|uniref:Uncharacterized protein n=1 Tax=Luteibaculum oceani TaxID=1294296 RepID=A0A5C6V9K1_9FLAO|nr:hypothetical protein [Luteibaculum oceani]TXC81384.1 hypothetical protein FRX97_05100 [Luteibaculum oceani]